MGTLSKGACIDLATWGGVQNSNSFGMSYENVPSLLLLCERENNICPAIVLSALCGYPRCTLHNPSVRRRILHVELYNRSLARCLVLNIPLFIEVL